MHKNGLEVVARGRRGDHQIEGVGHRRTNEPSYKSLTLAAHGSRDRRRHRSHSRLVWPPLPETVVPPAIAGGGHHCRARVRSRRRTSLWPRPVLTPSRPPSLLRAPSGPSSPLLPQVTAVDKWGVHVSLANASPSHGRCSRLRGCRHRLRLPIRRCRTCHEELPPSLVRQDGDVKKWTLAIWDSFYKR
jgi:hypothetical protein